jgi:hypothetical protein
MASLVHDTKNSFFSQNRQKDITPFGLKKQQKLITEENSIIENTTNVMPKQSATSNATGTANATFSPSGTDSTVDADVNVDL